MNNEDANRHFRPSLFRRQGQLPAARCAWITRSSWLFAVGWTLASPMQARAEGITAPRFPGKCLDARDATKPGQRGSALSLGDCNGSAAQDFKFDPATSTIALPRANPKLCLHVQDAPRNGYPARMQVCDGSAGQRWTFPTDGRIRSLGGDPNKCLTHTSRPGKPPTGWLYDVEVEPNCEFPEVGGGGICFPQYFGFWEVAVATCDVRGEQQWRLPQAGMPVQPNPSASGRTLVMVQNMRIDDCREAGTCDWRLDCGIGSEADVRLLNKSEKNTGGTIDVNRQLVHEGPLPVTVTCHVREFDNGIFDPDVWEVVGTTTRTFTAAGPASMGMDNSEGKVTIHFNITAPIQQPLSVSAPPMEPTRIEAMQVLEMAGIDFSVPESELRKWLANPEFTPYPAMTGALVKLFAGRRLKQPVFLDVIVFNYEHGPGSSSPRRMTDVDTSRLSKSVLEAHNKRYGTVVSDLRQLME